MIIISKVMEVFFLYLRNKTTDYVSLTINLLIYYEKNFISWWI